MQKIINNLGATINKYSPKIYWKEILTVVMLLLAIVFFRSERKELHSIIPHIKEANGFWVSAGFVITILYILFQAGIYKMSFKAIGLSLKWNNVIVLFLKRNFIGVFLPAGAVSALAYTPSQIRKLGFTKTQIYQASGLFGFAGLLSVFVVGLPVIIITFLSGNKFNNAWVGLAVVLLFIITFLKAVNSIKNKGTFYIWLDKKFPSFTPTLNGLFDANVNIKQYSGAVLFSLVVELSGMLHIYIAMLALGLPASAGASAAAYIIAVLMMVISPFLKGLGAVELAMVYVLEQFGYNTAQALSITVLFRVFEFWLPLLAGFIAFAWNGRKLFFRALPALLSFILGFINIISVVTPPLHNRLHLLVEYIPLTAVHASNLLVLFSGLALLVTAAFLFRGLRSAWIIALTLSVVSFAGHITKALDYEEAIIAAITVLALLTTTSQYRIRSSNKWMKAGFKTALISFAAVSLFGFISFYYIDVKHFGIDFTWQQSLVHTFKSFLLVQDSTLHPVTRFGSEIIWLIRISGFLTWGFLLFTVIKPPIILHKGNETQFEKASFLLSQFGNSPVDYFKLSKDKLHFFSDMQEAFIAYRIAGGFAIVLDEPVCADEYKMEVLREFDYLCGKLGLKPAFYRVHENSVPWFNQLKKKKLLIGQEAILDINKFSLQGKEKKSLRNGLNTLEKRGYIVTINKAPHTTNFLSALKIVSDEWLKEFHREESVFSQGMFDENEMKQQDIITLVDEAGNISAFLNIIPDYAEDECTYDLIRKTSDAPGSAMDALIIKLIEYGSENKKLYLNLGMVPMTGITQPDSTAEQIIKLAADKIKRFHHYKGLRMFKEKYATIWENKYLVYDNDFDLLQLPLALNTVMKP